MNTVNDLVSAGIGHNSGAAPLAEVLIEETVELKMRAAELIAGAQRAVVADLETAKRATLLVGMMLDHCKAIETARVARKQPYLDAGRTIDIHFAQLRTELAGSDPKQLGGEAARVKQLVDEFYAEEERKAATERRRLEEEARLKAEEAAAAAREREAAERRGREAALSGDVQAALSASGPRIDAELRHRQLQEESRRLTERAAETRVAPIDTGLGVKAHRKSNHRAEITSLAVALRHALRINPAPIRQAVQEIYDRQVRAGIRSLPGANVVEDRQTVFRRA